MPIKTSSSYRVSTRTQRAKEAPAKSVEVKKQTPDELAEERRKNYKPNHFEERKFFTVEEDYSILNQFQKESSKKSTREIAEELSIKIKHTQESIRDRIKRYISKLSSLDSELLKDASKVRLRPLGMGCIFLVDPRVDFDYLGSFGLFRPLFMD